MSYTEAALLAILIASNAFWAWQVQKLVNKLLSRSYYEFKQAENVRARRPLPKPPAPATPAPPVDSSAINALDQMRAELMPFSGGR